MLSRALYENEAEVKAAAATGKAKSTDFYKVVSGIIGTGMATQFHAFLDQTRYAVAAEDIFKNPKKAKMNTIDEIDALHATVTGVEYEIKRKPEFWKQVLVYATRKDFPLAELGLVLATTVTEVICEKLNDEERVKAFDSPEYDKVTEQWGDIITME
jgi:hypothetical protein